MGRKIFKDVELVRILDKDPNGYHESRDGGCQLEIILRNGKRYSVTGCKDCGFLISQEVRE